MKNALALTVLLSLASLATAQDPALLRPPKGAQVAIIRHDFPWPMHNWSFNAAVIARYFDTHSKELGNQFRDYIFQHQLEVNPDTLQSFAQKFATDHKVELPFVVDPQGKLAALVNEDK